LKIRRDALAVSSILFTLALLLLTPRMLENARTTHQSSFRDIAIDVAATKGDQVAIPNFFAPLGFASLAVIGIGLIVTWAGYIKAVRWTWFVMFVIVWLWAFPVLILPFFYPSDSTASIAQTMANTPADAIGESGLPRGFVQVVSESGLPRAFVEVTLVFLLMVVALVLPAKTFILGRGLAQGGPGAGI